MMRITYSYQLVRNTVNCGKNNFVGHDDESTKSKDGSRYFQEITTPSGVKQDLKLHNDELSVSTVQLFCLFICIQMCKVHCNIVDLGCLFMCLAKSCKVNNVELHNDETSDKGVIANPEDVIEHAGELQDDETSDKGVITNPEDVVEHAGELQDDELSGKGVITNPEDVVEHAGELQDDEPSGKGVIANPEDVVEHAGELQDDETSDKGVIANPEDVIEHAVELQDGKIKKYRNYFMYQDGRTYVGEWENGNPNGKGAMYFPDGRSYDGYFQDGKMQGQGTVTIYYNNGSRYEGELQDGEPNGKGVMVDPTPDVQPPCNPAICNPEPLAINTRQGA